MRRTTSHNSGLAKKRVQWLIEHSASYQLLWYIDSLVLRIPLLSQAANRCAKVIAALHLLHIGRRITSVGAFRLASLDLRHSYGFAKLRLLELSFQFRNFANQLPVSGHYTPKLAQ